MLNIQKWFLDGKTASELVPLGIYPYEHPSLPLIGFKYDQIEAQKTLGIVKECRGIVLEKGTWSVVAKPFGRFFNAGEDQEEFKKFNWNDFVCNTKEDGSLGIVYHYNGEWHFNTSGSFGLGEICSFIKKSWREVFWETFPGDKTKLNPSYTYLFELCTPYNKIIRAYPKPQVFLLGVFDRNTCQEFSCAEEDALAKEIGLQRPVQYHFRSMAEITSFLQEKQLADKTFEGVIIRDDKNLRFKIKTETYLALHHLKDNGNIFNPSRLVPLLLNEGKDEILAYFPEVKETMLQVEDTLTKEWNKLQAIWEQHHQIADQKAFALAIKDKTCFTGMLFTIRKQHGEKQTLKHLKDIWRQSADYIVKYLYK